MNPSLIASPAEEVLEEELAPLPRVRRAESSIWLAPIYVPPVWEATRPGADAHKSVATYGTHC